MAFDKVPGGYEKDRPWSQASLKTLQYYAKEARSAGLKAAAQAELDRRTAGGMQEPSEPPAAPAPTASAARQQTQLPAAPIQRVSDMLRSYRDASAITHALLALQDRAHLIAPATSCGTLPEGCEVVFSAVMVDPDTETYPVLGKRGLGKVALDKIAAAAAIGWHPLYTGRLDDGSDPHYCHYRAVGVVRTFDGMQRPISGEVEIDARDGSPQIVEIQTKAKQRESAADYVGRKDGGASQILELRKFLLRHAESKAKNRAIRSLGLRTAYTEKELREKPFVIARLMFTGRSDNPELARMFADRMADSFLNTSQQLYGPERPALDAPPQQILHRPPPISHYPEERVFDVTPDTTAPHGTASADPDADLTPPGPDDPDQQGLFDSGR